MKKRIVIAGMGETGLLVAVRLSKHYDVIGISSKPCLVSGQELGTRLTQPETWKQNYLLDFSRFKKLHGVKTLHGTIENINAENQSVSVKHSDGQCTDLTYDVLVIASGISNGFWRNNRLEDRQTIEHNIRRQARRLQQADTIAIIGGGPSGASTASNLKEQFPDKAVHFFYSQSLPLPGYHPNTRSKVQQKLNAQGVVLHAEYRAIIPENIDGNDFTSDPVAWQNGQQPFTADLTLWAVGLTRPNNSFIPEDMLTEDGFVKADEYLRVPGYDNIFTVGDIADSDPNRSSARNAGFLIAAHNIKALLQNRPARLKTYKAAKYRWGSILGVQKEGMRVFTPTGSNVRVNRWLTFRVLFPFFVRQLIYKGIAK